MSDVPDSPRRSQPPEATFVDPSPPLNAATRRSKGNRPDRLKGILNKALSNIDPNAAERVFDVLTGGGAQAPEKEVPYEDEEFLSASPVSAFPGSSRCAAARYVFNHEVLLMSWTNGKTPWVYFDVPFEVFTSFLSAPSHGKFVNEVLNNFTHRRVYQGDTYSDLIYGVMPNA